MEPGWFPKIVMRGEGFHVLSFHLSASYLSYWFWLSRTYTLTLLIATIMEVQNSHLNPKDNWHCFSGMDRLEMSNFSVNIALALI